MVYLISCLQAQRRYFLFDIQISSNLFETESYFRLYVFISDYNISHLSSLKLTTQSGSYVFWLALVCFKTEKKDASKR